MRFGFVLLFTGLLCAQSQPAVQDKCSLEGKVVNSATGEPVRKVRVTLTGIRRAAGTSAQAPVLPTVVNSGSSTFIIDTGGGQQVVTSPGLISSGELLIQAQALSQSGQRLTPFQSAAVTDSAGVFAFTSLDPGNYTISAQRDGFQNAAATSGR